VSPIRGRAAAVRQHQRRPSATLSNITGGMTVRSIINPRDFVAHPVPVKDPQDRMDRLASVTAGQMAVALAFLGGFDPETFDAILDAAEPSSGDLVGPDEAEPRCAECNASIGIFLEHGLGWQHYRGDGTTAGGQEVFFPGHKPVVSWRLIEDGLILC
jgi:hypothetical protein